MGISREAGSGDTPIADAALFVSPLGAQLHGPERPRRLRRAFAGRHGHDLELVYRTRFLPVAGSQAVGAGIATADDHHSLAGGPECQTRVPVNRPGTGDFVEAGIPWRSECPLVLGPALSSPRLLRASGQNDGIKFPLQFLHSDPYADVRIRNETALPRPTSGPGAGRECAFPA